MSSAHANPAALIEQYRNGEIYLSDVAKALNFYTDLGGGDVGAAMAWLQARVATIGLSAEVRSAVRPKLRAFVERRKAELAAMRHQKN